MKNNSVSDFVASTMDALLGSEEYKTLFHKGFVSQAQAEEPTEESSVDNSDADDFVDADANASDDGDDNDMRGGSCSDADEKMSSAFDVAINSLLTASAALDYAGMESGSSLSLKLASFVVDAKKKMPKSSDSDKKKADKKKADEKAKADKKKKSDADKKKSDSDKAKADDKKKSDAAKSLVKKKVTKKVSVAEFQNLLKKIQANNSISPEEREGLLDFLGDDPAPRHLDPDTLSEEDISSESPLAYESFEDAIDPDQLRYEERRARLRNSPNDLTSDLVDEEQPDFARRESWEDDV